MIEVVEVIGRAEQGITQPYICRGSDDAIYYVKGKGAGYVSLVKEWIAGNLARRFGLPVATIAALSVPADLFQAGQTRGLGDLGQGPVFGSKQVSNSIEIGQGHLGLLDENFRRDLAVFDFWVRNGDRSLSAKGGNPNILWSASLQRPFAIDHNLAFDPMVSAKSLEEEHIFGSDLRLVIDDEEEHVKYEKRFVECMLEWAAICDELPERWNFVDDKQTVRTGFSADIAKTTVERFRDIGFWDAR